MQQQYSFLRHPDRTQNYNHRNNTDQRLMEIMKKYQKPHRNTNLTPNRTENYNNDHFGPKLTPLLKTEQQERNLATLGEHNPNIEKYHRQSQDKWSKPRLHDDNPKKPSNWAYENRTPQGYRIRDQNPRINSYTEHEEQRTPEYQVSYAQETKDSKTTEFKFSHNREYEVQYDDYKRSQARKYTEQIDKQREYSPYGYHRQPNQDETFSRKSTYLLGRNNQDCTPAKKYSNRIATQFIDRGSVQKEYRKDHSKSINKQRFENIDCDTRISNIDKINDKIKRILENCPEVRKRHDSYIKERQYKLEATPSMGGRKQEGSITKSTHSPLNSRPQGDKSVSKQDSSFLKKDENQRSRSCLGKHIRNTEEQDDKYSKIQEKLNHYNNRVTGLAEEKKRLNLDLKLNKPEPTVVKKQNTKESFISNISKPVQQPSYSMAQGGSWISQDKNKSRGKLPQVEIVLSHRSNHVDIDSEEIQDRSNYFYNHQIESQQQDHLNQPSEIAQSINQNHQTFYQSLSNIETKKLVKLLSEQAKLDQQFRLAKNWFVNSQICQEHEVLQSILQQRWREMSLDEIKADFSVNFQEDDPFYSYRPDQFVLEDLVNNYIICNRNWKEKIEHKWDMQLLQNEGLFERLDMQGKGYIALQDVVRIVNMQQGTFYRNRDMYLIFQRMMKQSTCDSVTLQVFSCVLGTR